MKLLRKLFIIYQILVVLVLVCCSGCVFDRAGMESLKNRVESLKKCGSWNTDGENVTCTKIVEGSPFFKTVDWQTDYFRVEECFKVSSNQVNVPTDAIEYGLSNFFRLDRQYLYFDRITTAIRTGLRSRGCVYLYYISNGGIYDTTITYFKDAHQLLFIHAIFDSVPNAIDLSDVDVSVK